MMTRSDYQAVANSFRLLINDTHTNTVTLAQAIGTFCDYAEGTNPNFDRKLFNRAILTDILNTRESNGIRATVS